MLFTKELQTSINTQFEQVIDLADYKKDEIEKGLSCCNQLEEICMKFLYCSMPLSDIANYNFNLYLSYVKHALFLRENMPWGKMIPEDIFLNYVLFYRVNNENIEDCRKLFFDMIDERAKNKSMIEAILEVNYWCLEQATYQASDERTASPLTVLRSAYGRCGEESTFTVTALRSVGIPARQVYVPRWSHCDDNHAWVEVWCDGSWHYLGACEPEPVLDIGWFTAAASRAMVIHSRLFSSYTNSEQIISKNGKVTLINNLEKYANTKKVVVQILNSDNQPVGEVKIHFEVLNYSEFFPVATIATDKEGKAQITMGQGDIHIHAVKDNRFISKIVNTKEEDTIVLYWDNAITQEISNQNFDIVPPKDDMGQAVKLTDCQKEYSRKRFAQSDYTRKQKESHFYNKEKAQKVMDRLDCQDELLRDILVKSKGNYEQIVTFLESNENNHCIADKLKMLISLVDKDYRDITHNLLQEHLNNSLAYKEKYPEDIFINYLMNPRIYYENITNYREFILNYFDHEMQRYFIEQPREIWNYINKNIHEIPELEYKQLYTYPVELLKMKKGSMMSKKILFVAICRTLGIPARIHKKDLGIQYYIKDGFVNIKNDDSQCTARLILKNIDNTKWTYMQNWSLALLREGVYESLDLMDQEWNKDKFTIDLEPGNYRIITSNRMPNGSIFCKKYCFVLSNYEVREMTVCLRKAKIADMLENIQLADFKLYDANHNVVMADAIMKESKNIVVWIEEGKEPTEHILNEMIENKEIFTTIPCHIIFVLRNKDALTNTTLLKTLKVIPNIQLYYDEETSNASSIARRVYVDPDKLPLIIVTNTGLNVVYSFSGYNVGVSDLIVKIIQAEY